MTDFEQLSVFWLSVGDHPIAEEGVCAMEAVAWLEGLEHTDHPSCTCPVIATFMRAVNDSLPDDQRQRLVPYLPRLVGTVSPGHELERAQYLAWQAVVVFAPRALEAAGLHDHADGLRAVPHYDWAAAGTAAWAAEAAAWAAEAAVNDALQKTKKDIEEKRAAWAAEIAEAAVRAARAVVMVAEVAVRAARAAEGAAWAAEAAAEIAVYDEIFASLDGVLAIGPGGTFTTNVPERITAYRRDVLHETV